MKKTNLIAYMIDENLKLKRRVKTLEALLSEKSSLKEQFSVKEICEMYGIERKTFDNYRRDGLKVIQLKPNAHIFVKKSDFDNFLKTNNNGR
ncbi:helix-turn-helix domain-containing protein [Chryseobacterium gambrini]|uniref:Helix-turn-helix domain-containing protein n=1 Tax=Chryseobacterium gambrini TaxID=373672 RepID=A0A1N7NZ21_9FLAO|nr:helix-turn-helix domain-containing protein [Chryseobacterium gambrini]SIT03536.1 Helix-turn-helix domain-containing protein [Chryseobacterium gambrini]